MIKLEKTTKTVLKAKGLQVENNQIVDPETGEVINLIPMIKSAFGDDGMFDFTFTTSIKEESEVENAEPEEFDPEAEEY